MTEHLNAKFDSRFDRGTAGVIEDVRCIKCEFSHCGLSTGSSPPVNVVFHVPGSTGSPDWDGLRDAKFSRQQRLLMVQVAVPENIVESANPENFVIESLYGANAIAFEFFRQKNMDFPLAEAEQLVANIESRMKKAA